MRSLTRMPRALCATMLFVAPLSAANAQITTFSAFLNAANESPVNNSPGVGLAIVTLNQFAFTMRVQVTFAGLTGPNTAAHIHCCLAVPFTGTAGVATVTPTFTGFPAGTAGTYDNLFDMTQASSYNPAFVTANGGTVAGAYAALTNGLFTGRTYLNIHTAANGGGEIRGFLTAVPEPSTYALLASGLVALGVVARKRRRA